MNLTSLLDSFLIAVAICLAFSVTIAFGLLRKVHLGIRLAVVALILFVLTIPTCVGVAALRDTVLNPKGDKPPADVRGVMQGLDPPLSVERVRYFKNSAYETWLCRIDEESLVAWANTNELRTIDRESWRLRRSYPNFNDTIPQTATPDLYYDLEPLPNGAHRIVRYYREPGIAIYEGNYW